MSIPAGVINPYPDAQGVRSSGVILTDGDFTAAAEAGPIIKVATLPTTNSRYVLRQEFMQELAYFEPQLLGSAHPSESGFVLVQETDPTPIGGGLLSWTRVYARVPDAWDEWKTFNYAFIGFAGVTWRSGLAWATVGDTSFSGWVTVSGREREEQTVQSRIRHEYYLTGDGQQYTTPASIPILARQKYTVADYASVDHLRNENDVTLNGWTALPTQPTRTDYEAWIANAETHGWAAGVAPSGTNPGQIIAEDSYVQQWLGPIYERITRYVLAR